MGEFDDDVVLSVIRGKFDSTLHSGIDANDPSRTLNECARDRPCTGESTEKTRDIASIRLSGTQNLC